MSYYSLVKYNADGNTDTFAIPFSYISRDHVEVLLNGVQSSAFSFLSDTSIKTTTKPASGVVVTVRRNTSRGSKLVDYSNGSILDESNMDLQNDQLMYVCQEVSDSNADTVNANDAMAVTIAQADIATTKAAEANTAKTEAQGYAQDAAVAVASIHTHPNKTALDEVSGTNTGDQDLSGYAAKAVANVFTKTQTPSRSAVTPSAAIDWDASDKQVLEVTLTATRLFNAPTNLVAGTFYSIRLIGAYVPTWNAVFKNISSYNCVTTATKADFLTFYCSDGTNLELVGIMYNCNGGA